MSKLVASFVKDESGATAIEYGLIAALIALAWSSAPAHSATRSTTSSSVSPELVNKSVP